MSVNTLFIVIKNPRVLSNRAVTVGFQMLLSQYSIITFDRDKKHQIE